MRSLTTILAIAMALGTTSGVMVQNTVHDMAEKSKDDFAHEYTMKE